MRLRLNETLTLADARPLHGELMAARGTDLTLDASAVRQLGAQCAQVLLAARTAWAADARGFAIVEESAAFTEGVRLLGLTDHLQG